MIRKIAAVLMTAALAAGFSGCNKSNDESDDLNRVTLSVWCAEQDINLFREMVDEFIKQHSSEASFNITISAEGERTCKHTVLSNPQAAADIYTFAADQFHVLYDAGALIKITEDADTVISANGGADNGSIRSSSVNGDLYAYPMTSSNGYFLYYNSDYYTEDDVKSFDRLLEIAEENGKKVAMDFASGWYMFSFFKGAGMNVGLSDDGVTNYCDWNSTSGKYTGVDVAEAMLAISENNGFISCGDEEFVKGAQDGTIIAGINGTWNSTFIEEAFGDGYAAAKLPEFTIAGDSVQMASFTGYKFMGVNAYTEYPEWSMKLAEWLTNEENQLKRFRENGEVPSNVNAAAAEEVKASPATAALLAQSPYGYLTDVADNFWTATFLFGTEIAAGNADNNDLQQLLDDMVTGITALPAPSTDEQSS